MDKTPLKKKKKIKKNTSTTAGHGLARIFRVSRKSLMLFYF